MVVLIDSCNFFKNTNIIIYCTFLSKICKYRSFKAIDFQNKSSTGVSQIYNYMYYLIFFYLSCFCLMLLWRKDVCVHNFIDQWTSSLLISRFLFIFYPVTYWLRSFDVVDIYCWSPSSELIYLSKFRGFLVTLCGPTSSVPAGLDNISSPL